MCSRECLFWKARSSDCASNKIYNMTLVHLPAGMNSQNRLLMRGVSECSSLEARRHLRRFSTVTAPGCAASSRACGWQWPQLSDRTRLQKWRQAAQLQLAAAFPPLGWTSSAGLEAPHAFWRGCLWRPTSALLPGGSHLIGCAVSANLAPKSRAARIMQLHVRNRSEENSLKPRAVGGIGKVGRVGGCRGFRRRKRCLELHLASDPPEILSCRNYVDRKPAPERPLLIPKDIPTRFCNSRLCKIQRYDLRTSAAESQLNGMTLGYPCLVSNRRLVNQAVETTARTKTFRCQGASRMEACCQDQDCLQHPFENTCLESQWILRGDVSCEVNLRKALWHGRYC